MHDPSLQNDSRSVDELIDAAFNAFDEEERWNTVVALHWRGTKDVLVQAKALCVSEESIARRLGADILGQLGVPCRTYPRQCVDLLLGMIHAGEVDDDVLQAIFVAFSHLDAETAVPSAIQFADHPNPEVRQAIVLALSGHADPGAIDALIRLSEDEDESVRDWATFSLGTLTESDTPQLRNALVARLDDSGDDVRGEALAGLARRKDSRVIAEIREDIEAGRVSSFVLEAAELIADKQLLPELVGLRGHWDIDQEKLEQAIAACSK